MLFFVSYVKNNTFPQPLSQEDEKKYLLQMAEGDQVARNKLIEHNLRLVAHIVKKFDNTGEYTEDLISIGTRSEEHTSELQSRFDIVCRLLLEKKKLRNT